MDELPERRAQRERRRRNEGPPGDGADRRCCGERRSQPLVAGVVLTVAERRTLRERRQRDLGPPRGCSDRRRVVERRLPLVEERAISDAEWQTYFGAKA